MYEYEGGSRLFCRLSVLSCVCRHTCEKHQLADYTTYMVQDSVRTHQWTRPEPRLNILPCFFRFLDHACTYVCMLFFFFFSFSFQLEHEMENFDFPKLYSYVRTYVSSSQPFSYLPTNAYIHQSSLFIPFLLFDMTRKKKEILIPARKTNQWIGFQDDMWNYLRLILLNHVSLFHIYHV